MPDPTKADVIKAFMKSQSGESSPQRVQSSRERYLFCEFARLRDQVFLYEKNNIQYRVFYIQILDELKNELYRGYFTENVKEGTYRFFNFYKEQRWTKRISIFSSFQSNTRIKFIFTEKTKGISFLERVSSSKGYIEIPPLDYSGGYWEVDPFTSFFEVNLDDSDWDIQVYPNLSLGKKAEVEINFDESVKKFDLLIQTEVSPNFDNNVFGYLNRNTLKFTVIGPIERVTKNLPVDEIKNFWVFIPENNEGIITGRGSMYRFDPQKFLTKTEGGVSYYEISIEN